MFDFLKRKHNIIEIQKTPSTKLLAVAYTGKGKVPYFEQTDYYEIYVFENGRKVRKQMLSMPVNRVDDSVDLFRKMKIDTVICRGFSPRALHELKRFGIRTGVFEGGPGAALKAYREDTIQYI
ncbi:MAG: NifB/NifX family molybdenum-iron cluster-binding protein [Chordicoccus sp.]